MNDTSGPTFESSWTSADLQSSLESKLAARLDVNGSPEYELTWKHWDMPWGPPISRLRALARRTSVNVSTGSLKGWTTPQAHDSHPRGKGNRENPKGGGADLAWDAQLAGWPTPNSGPQNDNDSTWQERRALIKAEKKNGNGFGMTLGMAAQLTGWSTPNAPRSHDSDWTAGRWYPETKNQTDPVLQLLGRERSSSAVLMAKRGALNPRFSLWLQGYPETWADYAPQGTRSLRR